MGRRVDTSPETDLPDERVLEWRYSMLAWPIVSDPPGHGDAVWRRIVRDRDRLDATGLPIADRLDELAAFVSDVLGCPGVAARALKGETPERWEP
jgi:hypothetical protein